MDVNGKLQAVVTAAVNYLSAERADESNAYYGAHTEWSGELLALSARDLVRSVDALPPRERPIGWDTE